MFTWIKTRKVGKRLRQELDRLRPDAEGEAQNPLSADDESDFEGPTARQRTAQLLRAFHHLESGDYGHCMSCGQPIEKERLEDDVAASSCAACSEIIYD